MEATTENPRLPRIETTTVVSTHFQNGAFPVSLEVGTAYILTYQGQSFIVRPCHTKPIRYRVAWGDGLDGLGVTRDVRALFVFDCVKWVAFRVTSEWAAQHAHLDFEKSLSTTPWWLCDAIAWLFDSDPEEGQRDNTIRSLKDKWKPVTFQHAKSRTTTITTSSTP